MPNIAVPRGGGLERFRDRYGRALEVVVAILVIGLALEVTIGVVFRALGRSLSWYDELASVMLAWLTFYGSALASVRRAHIGCPEVVDQAPPRVKRALNIVAQVFVIAFFALLGWVGASILPIIASESLVSLPSVSMAVVQSVIPVSCVLILVAEVLHLVALTRPVGAAAPASALSEGLH